MRRAIETIAVENQTELQSRCKRLTIKRNENFGKNYWHSNGLQLQLNELHRKQNSKDTKTIVVSVATSMEYQKKNKQGQWENSKLDALFIENYLWRRENEMRLAETRI